MSGLDASGSEWGSLASSREHGNESSGSIKRRKFLEQLSDY